MSLHADSDSRCKRLLKGVKHSAVSCARSVLNSSGSALNRSNDEACALQSVSRSEFAEEKQSRRNGSRYSEVEPSQVCNVMVQAYTAHLYRFLNMRNLGCWLRGLTSSKCTNMRCDPPTQRAWFVELGNYVCIRRSQHHGYCCNRAKATAVTGNELEATRYPSPARLQWH